MECANTAIFNKLYRAAALLSKSPYKFHITENPNSTADIVNANVLYCRSFMNTILSHGGIRIHALIKLTKLHAVGRSNIGIIDIANLIKGYITK